MSQGHDTRAQCPVCWMSVRTVEGVLVEHWLRTVLGAQRWCSGSGRALDLARGS